MESVLLEFLGSECVIDETTVRRHISSAGIHAEKVDAVVSHLVKLTFLGVEVDLERFQYADEPRELKKAYVLATRYSGSHGGERRYEINPAFRAYLEVRE